MPLYGPEIVLQNLAEITIMLIKAVAVVVKQYSSSSSKSVQQ
jgi:hypothetical protein